jgi:hypothetical protein
MKFLNSLNKVIAASLILITGLFGFMAAGSMTMTLRDYDASIGLLKRPAKTFSNLAKFFQPLEAEAQSTVFCANCLNESSFNIEKILNKLLRDIVLAFVKSFINILAQAFDKLLSMVEQWASTILGIQLNLSSIRKFVALQTVQLYNQIEGSVNQYFDDLLGPLEGKIGTTAKNQTVQALSSAATTAQIAAGVRGSCENGPGGCSSNPPPNPEAITNQIVEAASDIAGAACAGEGSGQFGDSDVGAAAEVASIAFTDTTCFGLLPKLITLKDKLETRNNETKQQASVATKDENIKPGNPTSCSPFLKTDADLSEAKAKFGTPNTIDFSNPNTTDFSNASFSNNIVIGTGTPKFSNPVLDAIGDVTFGTQVSSLSQSECDAANKFELNKEKLREGTKAKNAPEGEDLGAILQQLLQDFIDSVFKALEQIITKILDAAFQAIATAINSIGIREISGPLSEAFSKVRSGVNGSVTQALRNAREEIKRAVR